MSMGVPNPIDTDGDGTTSQEELQAYLNTPFEQRVASPDFEAMAEMYGFASGYLSQTPALQELLDIALQRGMTDVTMIKNFIANSDWGLRYTSTYNEAEQLRLGAPKVWQATVNRTATEIKQRAQNMGADISDAEALDYAQKFLLTSSGDKTSPNYEEFDDDWLDRVLSSSIDFSKTKTLNGVTFYDLSGTAENQAETLYQLAYEYGMDTSMSNAAFTGWFENSVKRLAGRQTTTEDLDDEVVNYAMSRFPGLQQQLARGLTLRQAADPYMKAISEVLEFDPNTLSFDDNLVQQVLNSVDGQGNFKPMSLYDAKLAARRDDRWQYTSTAKNEYTGLASTILKDFGFLG
jgi:hypothetical protein